MSKLDPAILRQAIGQVLTHSTETKKRNFVETIELQVAIKNYDTATDKRFNGSVRLPSMACPRRTVCLFGDVAHCEEAQRLGIPYMDVPTLKAFKRDKKKVKKLGHQYNFFLASDTIFKQIPRLLGPTLNKMGKFPTMVTHSEDLQEKINEVKSTVKFQLKKVLCMSVPIANVQLSEEDIYRNVVIGVNFLVSLMKKRWQNVKRLHLTSTMGPSVRLY
eukprot:gnl/Trimastix_PCT/63.p1 GENE.gnl/Trimastix_PCT/63~~gnl/Trimastix_PCT/63.p1  ORF type:complete len:218 (+),score=82.61 gnl/Trimastix_PCT/63:93-746(+)